MAEIVFYAKWEITQGGALDKTIKSYIQDLGNAGFIKYKHPFWQITTLGKEWLERYGV